VRTWDISQTRSALEAVHDTDITICAGFHDNPNLIGTPSPVREDILAFVREHKNSDSILIWTIINEFPHQADSRRQEDMFMWLQLLVNAVKSEDQDHLIMIVLTEFPKEIVPSLNGLSVDIIGLNAYTIQTASASDTRPKYRETIYSG
jgi:hypothetical protein